MSADDFFAVRKMVDISQDGGDQAVVYEGPQLGAYVRLLVNDTFIDLLPSQARKVASGLTAAAKHIEKRSKA